MPPGGSVLDGAVKTGAVGGDAPAVRGPRVIGVAGGIVELGGGAAEDWLNGSGPGSEIGCRKISPEPIGVTAADSFFES